MDKIKLVLASKSPRRQSLIASMGFPFEVRIKEVDEVYPQELKPEKVPEFLAELKAKPLIDKLKDGEVLITSDTVVIHEGKILGKPSDYNDAFQMLQSLSGNSHKVVTGVCMQSKSTTVSFSETTIVHFSNVSKDEIDYYIENFKPYDKAGAYGIQEWIGAIAVHKIEGCYYNVMGLPVHKVYSNLKECFIN
ncbi:MAG: Maf family nucleotide pyrophosphatase [Crocinitomicaceae bacterium]